MSGDERRGNDSGGVEFQGAGVQREQSQRDLRVSEGSHCGKRCPGYQRLMKEGGGLRARFNEKRL